MRAGARRLFHFLSLSLSPSQTLCNAVIKERKFKPFVASGDDPRPHPFVDVEVGGITHPSAVVVNVDEGHPPVEGGGFGRISSLILLATAVDNVAYVVSTSFDNLSNADFSMGWLGTTPVEGWSVKIISVYFGLAYMLGLTSSRPMTKYADCIPGVSVFAKFTEA